MLAVTSSLSSVSCYLAKCKTCTAVTCGIWQDHKSQLGTSQQEMATSHQGVIGQPAKCCGDVHWREPLNSVLKRSMERQPLVLPSRGVTTGGCPSMKLPSSIRWPGTDLMCQLFVLCSRDLMDWWIRWQGAQLQMQEAAKAPEGPGKAAHYG
ncbi:TPA: hypothetical protein ACH3X3_011775 [Trebouxia sp. C0006]